MGILLDEVGKIYKEHISDPVAAEDALGKLFSLDLNAAKVESQEEKDKKLADAVAQKVSDKLTPAVIDPQEAERLALASFYPSLKDLGKTREPVENESVIDSLYPTMRGASK